MFIYHTYNVFLFKYHTYPLACAHSASHLKRTNSRITPSIFPIQISHLAMRSIYLSHQELPNCLYITPTIFSYSNITHTPLHAHTVRDSRHPFHTISGRFSLFQHIHHIQPILIVIIPSLVVCILCTIFSIVIEPLAYLQNILAFLLRFFFADSAT